MNNKCRLLLFRNSNILKLHKIQARHIFPILAQKGGTIKGKIKLTVEYDNIIYTFYESEIDENHYVLYTDYEEENPNACVIIVMSKIDDTKFYQAEIHGIGNDKSCLHDSKTNIGVGSILLKLTLKMLKKYNNKLKIKHITLTDNSTKFCDSIKDGIKLSLMLTLLTGHTWYGKYGFRPFNTKLNNYNDILLKSYNKNIEIMNSITIKEANILIYIELTEKKQIIEDVTKLLETNPDMLLKDFLNLFLKDYNKSCKYFSIFYEKLYIDIGLYSFHQNTFGLIY
jgi:hypothetical protein